MLMPRMGGRVLYVPAKQSQSSMSTEQMHAELEAGVKRVVDGSYWAGLRWMLWGVLFLGLGIALGYAVFSVEGCRGNQVPLSVQSAISRINAMACTDASGRRMMQAECAGERYPFVVKMVISAPGSFRFCTGFIISSHEILTAGHCAVETMEEMDVNETAGLQRIAVEPYGSVGVIYGCHDLRSPSCKMEVARRVEVHPVFWQGGVSKAERFVHDIALVEVWGRFDMEPENFAEPVFAEGALVALGLQEGSGGTVFYGAGFGLVTPEGKDAIHLRYIDMYVEYDQDAEGHCRVFEEGNASAVNPGHKFCLRSLGAGDVCPGDSGSPLILEGRTVLGVLSTGNGCQQSIWTASQQYVSLVTNAAWIASVRV